MGADREGEAMIGMEVYVVEKLIDYAIVPEKRDMSF